MPPEGAESWRITAQSELFSGWRRWLSFALIWAWSCVAGMVSLQPYVLQGAVPILAFGNGVVLLFCVLALVGVLVLGGRIATACGSRRYILVGWAFLVAGSTLILLSLLLQSYPLYFLGASCGGVSIGILKVAWGEMYSLMPLKASMVSMAYALLLSSVVALLVRMMPPVVLGALLLAASLPLGHLLYTGAKSLSASESAEEAHVKSGISWFVFVLPALVGLSYGVFKVGAPLVPEGRHLVFDIQTAGLWANLIAGAVLLVLSRYLGQRVTPLRIIVADMVIVVAGLLLLAAPAVSSGVASVVHELGFSLFYFFMIVYWGDLARRMRTPVILTYTSGYLAMMAAQLVGGTLGAATGRPYLEAGDMTLTYALVLLLVVGLAIASSSSDSSRRRPLFGNVAPPEATDQTSIACERLADAFALTPREREVLNVLARGRNAAHIAEELFISQDTAKSHIKNIYRKLDVHTQQELLDLVEG